MAITLEQAQRLTQEKLYRGIIDEFRKDRLMDLLTYDDAASPVGNGSGFVYVYNRRTVQATAAIREINSDFTDQNSETDLVSIYLKIMGGSFAIDRAISEDGNGIVNIVTTELEQKIKATRALYVNNFLHGTASGGAWDGLDTQCDSSMVIDAGGLDISDGTGVTANYQTLSDYLYDAEALMDGQPTVWLISRPMYAAIQKCKDRIPGVSLALDKYGATVTGFNNTQFLMVGDYSADGSSYESLIPTDDNGYSTIYGIRIGIDGVHGITTKGNAGIHVYVPRADDSAAVRRGAVEFRAASVIKSMKSCTIIKNIKIA